MATRSTIAVEHADGTVSQVYCHWDGYLEHNGRLLQEHYTIPDLSLCHYQLARAIERAHGIGGN